MYLHHNLNISACLGPTEGSDKYLCVCICSYLCNIYHIYVIYMYKIYIYTYTQYPYSYTAIFYPTQIWEQIPTGIYKAAMDNQPNGFCLASVWKLKYYHYRCFYPVDISYIYRLGYKKLQGSEYIFAEIQINPEKKIAEYLPSTIFKVCPKLHILIHRRT